MYSPGRSRKKNATAIMSATHTEKAVAAMRAVAMMFIRIGTGIGLTLLGGGSCLV